MEYIYVEFPEERIVLVDDLASGNTNDTLCVQRGMHVITLSGAPTVPLSQTVTVINTSFPEPMRIVFN